MKKRLRIISLLIAVLCLVPLASCRAKDTSPTALSMGDYRISEAFYSYFASSSKGGYIRNYSDLENTAEGYAKKLTEDSDLTVGEYLDALTLDSAKMTLVAIKLFDDYGLSISADEKQSVSDYVSDLITEYGEGDRKMFNEVLATYGLNTDILEDIYLEESKTTAVYNYLYGDSGKEKLNAIEQNEFLTENYVHFQMIYINNAYKNVTDENGNYEYDDEGYVKITTLEGEEKAEKDALVKKCEKLLADGEDFFEVYEKYSEVTDYEGGWYLSPSGSYDDEIFVTLATECGALEIGEYKTVETDTGTCIIYRLEVEEGAYDEEEYSDFFEDFNDDACGAAYREKLTSMFDEIETSEDIIKKYTIADIMPCYY